MVRLIFLKEKTIHKLIFTAGLLSIFGVGCKDFDITPIVSSNFNGFDANDEGWHVSEGGMGSYSATGGNPGGYLIGTDNATGAWYFIASKSLVSEVRKNYVRTLNFDLKQSAIDFQSNTSDDVILMDGTNTLTFDTAYNPKTTWTHYSIKLDEFSGWKKGKVKATKADMQTVLQNLTELRIRGEFRAGPDWGGLDNVAIY